MYSPESHIQSWNKGDRANADSQNSESIYTLTFDNKIESLRQIADVIDGTTILNPASHCPRLKARQSGVELEARCAWDNPEHINLDIKGLSPAQAIAAIKAIQGESCN